MTVFLFANNAHSTLAGPIASGATSLALAAGTGVLFPAPTVGQQFELTLTSQQSQTVSEIVYCTARNGDICTIVRGREGTTPGNFIAGDAVDNFLTAGTTAAFTQATQLQQQAGNYAVDTGTGNNLVISRTPAPASLASTTGEPIRILCHNANTSGVTLADSGLPATLVLNTDFTSLDPGEIQAGAIITVIFDGTRYQLLSPVGIIHPGNIQAFSTPGVTTFTVPTGVYLLKKVRTWGAGGGGGGVNGIAQSSGGGGGGYAEGPVAVIPGQVIQLQVGAGGPGGNGTPTNGSAGGTSAFGAGGFYMSATGGGPGFASNNGAQGVVSPGGTGSGGAVNLAGTSGSGGDAYTNGGAGGSSPLGIAGGPPGSINNTGSAGLAPGGGGGGTSCTSGGQAGGSGGNGYVIVEW